MNSFFDFITSPLGSICIGVASSILGTLLYVICVAIVKQAGQRIKKKKYIKHLVRIGESFSDGYTTAYARVNSPFHQMLHVGNHEIGIMVALTKILIVAIAGVGLLVVFQELIIARPIIVAITCLLIAFYYKILKGKLEMYQIMFDYTFGEDYKEHMMKGVEKHWDSIVKKQSVEGVDIDCKSNH